ncbi:MAG: haloacid dehalogenase-like hydrolase [Muribaculaceae bacterium]|nr:haloacid dehalogenase-like hydrolase [Muribaculaceae bacterium]MDD6019393.1 HAD family hydrolase [bacterium]
MNNQKLAIFEFDGTVIEGNSMFLFFREVSGGAIPYIWGLLSTSGIAMCRALRLCSKKTYYQHLTRHFLRGMTREEIMAASRQFLFVLNKSVRGKVIAGIQKRRLDNYRMVLMSEGLADVIRPWAAQFGISDVMARELEYDADGRFTGSFAKTDDGLADLESTLQNKLNATRLDEVLAVSRRRKNAYLEKIATRYCLL